MHNVWQLHELRFVVFSFFLSLSVMYNTSHISVASLVSAEVNNVYSVTHEWRGNISTEYLWFFKAFDRFFVRLKDKLLWKRDRMNNMKDWRGVFFYSNLHVTQFLDFLIGSVNEDHALIMYVSSIHAPLTPFLSTGHLSKDFFLCEMNWFWLDRNCHVGATVFLILSYSSRNLAPFILDLSRYRQLI